MIPGLRVTLGQGETVLVEPTTNALWLMEETVGNFAFANRFAVMLTVAFYGIEGEPDEPVDLARVRSWARANQVRVTEVEDSRPDPTPARSTGP